MLRIITLCIARKLNNQLHTNTKNTTTSAILLSFFQMLGTKDLRLLPTMVSPTVLKKLFHDKALQWMLHLKEKR